MRDAGTAWRLWLLCLLSYGCFFSANNSNVISRIGLTLGIVERHELTLGPLAADTLDQAIVRGTAYSDKAPGLSFLAIPATAIVASLSRADINRPGPALSVVTWFATLSTVSLIAAAAVAALYRWTRSRNASRTAALIAALTAGFATPFWGWSTVFFGHAASGGLLLLGFIALTTAIEKPSALRGWLAGLALGAAFVVEFPAGPPVAIIGLCCAADALTRPHRRVILARVFLPAAAGLAIAIAPLLAYDAAAFGSAWKIGYMSVQGFTGMRTGLLGVSWPDPKVVLDLLFGWNRGLVPLAPVMLLYPFAVAVCLRARRWRLAAIVSVPVFAYYLVMNAGYAYWNGGDSTGPRHLVPALPFMALLLAPLWDASARPLRAVFATLLIISIFLSLVCVSVDMWVSPDIPRPLLDSLLPRFLSGDLPRPVTTALPGFLALLPLAAAWLIILGPLLPRGKPSREPLDT